MIALDLIGGTQMSGIIESPENILRSNKGPKIWLASTIELPN